MKLELKIQLLKFFSVVFNSFFLVLGLCVVGCAVWMLFDQGTFLTILSSTELRTVALGLLVIGGVVAAVSVTGFVGAARENRVLLLTYLGFLIMLVLGQMFVSVVLVLNRNKIEQSLYAAVDRVIQNYGGGGHRDDALMDSLQHYGECCGRNGSSDWARNVQLINLNLTGSEVLPCSCFNDSRPSFNSSWCCQLFTEPLFGTGQNRFSEGCDRTLGAWLQQNALTVLALDVGLILTQVIQFVLVVNLYRASSEPLSRAYAGPSP